MVPEKKLQMVNFQREDSGIESDHQQSIKDGSIDFYENESESSHSSPLEMTEEKQAQCETFLDPNIDYVFPNFTFNQIDEIIAFTLHVKNVDPSSIAIDRNDLLNIAHLKFSSIGAGFFPIHYSFCVKFPLNHGGIFREITAEAWDNNVILQFELNNYDFAIYQVGLKENDLATHNVVEGFNSSLPIMAQSKDIDDILSIEVRSHKESELVIEVARKDVDKLRHETSNDEISEDVFDEHKEGDCVKRQNKKSTKKRNKKVRSMSESFCDQLKVINELDSLNLSKDENESKGRKKTRSTLSESSDENDLPAPLVQSHHQFKSILKNRGSYSECNESSIDDHPPNAFYSMSADFGISESLSESCKKTVRFSDNIKKQLFR